MPPPLSPEQLAALRIVPIVGDQPNRLRVALKMTGARQVDVVAATGIPAPNVSEFVNGKYRDLHVDTARKFSEFFGCSIEDLFPPKEAV